MTVDFNSFNIYIQAFSATFHLFRLKFDNYELSDYHLLCDYLYPNGLQMKPTLSPAAKLTIDLVRQASVTPNDAQCQDLIRRRLEPLGFKTHSIDSADVKNSLFIKGDAQPMLLFAGHTDVVPTGDEDLWTHPPFSATLDDGYIYGRGSSDMKAGVAASIIALEQFIEKHPDFKGSLALVLTSDEEGPATDGMVKVVEWMKQHKVQPQWCILSEPSSTLKVGDTIKNGRRGSLSGWIEVKGKQGHVGYPHLADNAIHQAIIACQHLLAIEWDTGNEFFDPSTFQIVNFNAGTGTSNVIPGSVKFDFNLRFSSQLSQQEIQQKVADALDTLDLTYHIHWKLSGQPFITEQGQLLDVAQQSIKKCLSIDSKLSTSGGTSDGRFLKDVVTELIELGTTNESIHKIDERVAIHQIDELATVYLDIITSLMASK